MKKKDIYIIAFISVILSILMIFFHSNKNSKIILDKNNSTKKEEENADANKITVVSQTPDTVTNKKVVVYISGEVIKPQVVEMQEGSRLIDAIERCGGMTEDADKDAVNLALLLNDEDHYIIPKKGEETQINNSFSNKKNDLININTADKNLLMTLPSFGEKTADKVIEYRQINGKFETIDDLKNVSGIGEKKFEQVKDLITVK